MPTPAPDGLTGLPTRAAFHAMVNDALASAASGVGVIVIDIDGFAGFNAIVTPASGDLALGELAQRLVREVGSQGTVARLDGDEFAVMMPGCDAGRLREMAQLCHAAMRFPLPGSPLMLTASVGTALGPQDAETGWELINAAAVAQFVAKAGGRDRVAAAKPTMRTQLERSVREGISAGAFGLAWQPMLTLQDEPSLAGVEGFLRWHHPTRGLIFPGNFLPLLEDARLARLLAAAALGEAVAQAKRWLDQRLPVGRVTINLSVHQLREGDLEKEIQDALAIRRVPPTALALELPPDAYLLPDLAPLAATLKRLRETGVSITVDSGPSSAFNLEALQRLPIDCIKLDRGYAKTLSKMELAHVVHAIHGAGLVTGAEGVEAAEHQALLAEARCDHAQGWGIGRPMPAAKLSAFVGKLGAEVRAAA